MSAIAGVVLLPLAEVPFDLWLRLWHGYLVFYEADLAPELDERNYVRMQSADGDCHGCCAVVDGAAVGLAHWIYHRTNWSDADSCYLQDLFVAPQFRGRGVGRALIEHVTSQAAARRCSKVHWLTHETNAGAMLLYDRVAARSGFVEYEKELR